MQIMHKIVLTLFIILFPCFNIKCQIFDTISVGFKKITTQKTNSDTITGHIYQNNSIIISIVNKPVDQWIIIEKSKTIIYYPSNNKAFRILNHNSDNHIISFFQYFTSLARGNSFLADLDYAIEKYELQGDTLAVYWKPPENLNNKIGNHIIYLKNDRIIASRLYDTAGKILNELFFDHFIKYNNQYFPLKIETIQFVENILNYEQIVYDSPVFDEPLPKDISEFILPASCEVKDIAW